MENDDIQYNKRTVFTVLMTSLLNFMTWGTLQIAQLP
jgi:hypothetical protein